MSPPKWPLSLFWASPPTMCGDHPTKVEPFRVVPMCMYACHGRVARHLRVDELCQQWLLLPSFPGRRPPTVGGLQFSGILRRSSSPLPSVFTPTFPPNWGRAYVAHAREPVRVIGHSVAPVSLAASVQYSRNPTQALDFVFRFAARPLVRQAGAHPDTAFSRSSFRPVVTSYHRFVPASVGCCIALADILLCRLSV